MHVIAGDRNLRTDGFGPCSSGVNNIWQINGRNPSTVAAYTNSIHKMKGNCAVADGHVEQANSRSALTNLMSTADDNGSVHLLLP